MFLKKTLGFAVSVRVAYGIGLLIKRCGMVT